MTLVAEAQADPRDDSPAMNEVVRRFQSLATKTARSLSDCPHLRQDLANAALLGVVKATRRHTIGTNGFVAFVTRYMTGAALRERRAWLGSTPVDAVSDESLEAAMPPAPSVEETADLGDPWDATYDAVASLSERQQRLVALRYVEDLPLAEIAQIDGTSVSAVSQRLLTAHRAIEAVMAA